MADLGLGSRKTSKRTIIILVTGFVLGALVTELAIIAIPPSAAREFFVTTVAASLDAIAIDLKVIAVSIGPFVLRVNFLSVVGVLVAAWIARALL